VTRTAQPTRTGLWWTAVLFIVGSSCFALGSFPPYSSWVGASADGVTYFVGSLFFTSAATLQFHQSEACYHAIFPEQWDRVRYSCQHQHLEERGKHFCASAFPVLSFQQRLCTAVFHFEALLLNA